MLPRCPFPRQIIAAVILLALAPLATRAAPPAAGTWTATSSMHMPRGFQAATLLPSGLVLVAGGCQSCSSNDPQVSLASAELYHPHTGSWANTGSMHDPRIQYTATLLRDGRVLVNGGCRTVICTIVLASAELYHPHTGNWARTGSMHSARWADTETLLPDGRVLVAGGASDNSGDILASAELFDPRTGMWSMTGTMHQARARHTATLLPDGRVLVGGGAGGGYTANSDPLSSAELFSPRTGTWTLTGSLHHGRLDHSATVLGNGVVLAAGGHDTIGDVPMAEIYHPGTGTWTVTGSLHQGRNYQTGGTATLLHNGRVLVVGTFDAGAPTAKAETYNPRTGTWTGTGSMLQARGAPTTTLLPDGRVLVAGGAGSSQIFASAELYHP